MLEPFLNPILEGLPVIVLLGIILVTLLVLGKGADLLVSEAVALSIRWGVPTVVIGATIVSLGTTLPEAAVSVAAAISGEPDLALGNAVGSIIADTGLILGLAGLIAPLPLNRKVINRQGWIQLGAGFLLVLVCLPWSNLGGIFVPDASPTESGAGRLPQWIGILFVILLVAYIWQSLRWARKDREQVLSGEAEAEADEEIFEPSTQRSALAILLKLGLGIFLVILSAKILIPTVDITATRIGIPQAIIAATLVAFGTSLPELVTAVTAARKGHGGLAVGNIIGADILNVLFVAGLSAAVTTGGLYAPHHFFTLLFPGMLLILIIFRVGVIFSAGTLRRPFAIILILSYIAITAASFTIFSDIKS